MKMHSTGLLETLLVMQCTQSHMGSASAQKGRLLAHTLRRRRDCIAPTTLYIEADKGSQRLRGLFTQYDRCNQVEMAFAPTKVHVAHGSYVSRSFEQISHKVIWLTYVAVKSVLPSDVHTCARFDGM